MGKAKKVTVGYKYYLGFHIVPCYGPIDSIKKLIAADREFLDSEITSTSTVAINKPKLFGGEDREGGIVGNLDVMMGESTQSRNSYLQGILGNLIPAYRGVVSVISNQMYLKAYNPYFDGWSILGKRTSIQTDGSAQWNSTKANINGDMNPVHIIRECLINKMWGMGYPTTSIDGTNFTTVANTLYDEGFGLSLKWSQTAEIQEFINIVQSHVDCILYQDAFTGKFKIKLIRDDYTIGALPVFNEDNIVAIKDHKRANWGETINELTVVYTDVDNFGKKAGVTVQNLGNIQMQGSVIRQKKEYLGITKESLAAKVATRDLNVLSSALSAISIITNRDAWDLTVGDPFVFSWEKYGIVQQVFRVTKIDRGSLTDNKISLDAIEDKFALSDAVYLSNQGKLWTLPNNEPASVTNSKAMTAGYWDVNQVLGPGDIAALDESVAFLSMMTTFATSDTTNCEVRVDGIAANLQNEETKTATTYGASYCTLDGDIVETDTILPYLNGINMVDVEASDTQYLMIDNGTDIEFMRISSIDTGAETITVVRGVLDTPPRKFYDGDEIWFPTLDAESEDLDRLSGELLYLKYLPITGLGRLDDGVSGSYDESITLSARYKKPYAPGNLRIDGDYYPTSIVNAGLPFDTVFTWNHRDRTINLGPLIGHVSTSDSGDGTEAGSGDAITYRVTVYNMDSAPVQLAQTTVASLKTYTYSNTTEIFNMRFDVEAFLDYGGPNQIQCFKPARCDYAINHDPEISHWTFDEASGNSVDLVGSNDATNSGITYSASPLITDGGLCHTYSDGDFTNVPNDATLNKIRCVELWFNASSLTGSASAVVIVSRHSSTNSYNGWWIQINSDGAIKFLGKNGSIKVVDKISTSSISTGITYHIVVNFGYSSSDAFQLYINNVLEVNSTMGGTWTQGAYQMRIGKSIDTFWSGFSGDIDDVNIYARNLSVSEVDDKYVAGTT